MVIVIAQYNIYEYIYSYELGYDPVHTSETFVYGGIRGEGGRGVMRRGGRGWEGGGV